MPITTPDGMLYTTTEAADLLGLKPASIRYAIARGVLAVVRTDKRTVFISGQEIERYRRDHLHQRGPRKKTQPPAEPAPEEKA